MDKCNKIVDYLRCNGIYLTDVSNTKGSRRFRVESLLYDDTLIALYNNNLFEVLIWNKGVEIILEGGKKYFFKYRDKNKMIFNIRNIISVNGYYNESFLNKKIESVKLDFNLANKAKEIINFLKPYSVMITSLASRREGFTLHVSLGYIQLVIVYGLDECYYLTVLTNDTKGIESEKFKAIISKLYGEDGMNFWVDDVPFYDKLSDILNLYFLHVRKSESLITQSKHND